MTNSLQSCKILAAIFTTIFFLLFSVRTNAQWSELGGANTSTFNLDSSTYWGVGGFTEKGVKTDNRGNLYASGLFREKNGNLYVTKWNGSNWSKLGVGIPNNNDFIYAMATDSIGNVYVGGLFENSNSNTYIAKWNGIKWSELTDSVFNFNGEILNIETDVSGNVYANTYSTDKVYKWNGINWGELGTNSAKFNGHIQCITTDAVGNVYIAGDFTNTNGKNYVAKWNGNSWSELGGINNSTFNGGIGGLSVDHSGNVYITGNFQNSNGKYYVAKWNGSSWSELGGTNTSTFNTGFGIALDSKNNIYAYGGITNANGKYYVAKWDGNSWSELGGKNSSTFNGAVAVTIDKKDNIYAYGNFTNDSGKVFVAQFTQPLPVKLASIIAKRENKTIYINWQTATELNTTQFAVQRSADGENFKDIGTVKAIGNGANSYEFTDYNPANGINYYRLQCVDKDVSGSYSKVVSVKFGDNQSFSTIPNPARDFATISFTKSVDKATIAVYDMTGKQVVKQSLNGSANTFKLNTQSLKSGLYMIKVNTATGNYNEKLLINK